MNIATVVEGPTDRLVLKAVIGHLCPGDHRYFDLQPIKLGDAFGERGAGWKGVRRWCWETWKRQGSSLQRILAEETGSPLDLLVIQVDADIVLEADLQEGLENPIRDLDQPCPPIVDTVEKISAIMSLWLNITDTCQLPDQVIFAIPSQDMENWTFTALFPSDRLCRRADYECFQVGQNRENHPGYRLTLRRYGKLLKRDGTEIKKSVNRYRLAVNQIAENWDEVRRVCSQAQSFHQTVLERLGIN